MTYPGIEDWTELFDLQTDPYEMKNLARDPAHAGSFSLEKELAAHEPRPTSGCRTT